MADTFTPSAITSQIAQQLQKELDEPFKRMLMDKVDIWRGRLLRNTLQEKPGEDIYFMQTIWVPMERAKQIPACVGAPSCYIARSKEQVPKPLRYTTSLYSFIGAADGKERFKQGVIGLSEYMQASKYTGKVPIFDFVNGFLEVDLPSLPTVRIDGVFDKPTEAMAFNCSQNAIGCDYWNQPYPITSDVLQMVIQGIVQTDFNKPTVPAAKETTITPQTHEIAPDGR